MKANLTRGNSVTENHQPDPIDCALAAIAQICNYANNYAIRKSKKPIQHYPKGIAIVGEKGREIIQDKNGNTTIIQYGVPDKFGNVLQKGCFDNALRNFDKFRRYHL